MVFKVRGLRSKAHPRCLSHVLKMKFFASGICFFSDDGVRSRMKLYITLNP